MASPLFIYRLYRTELTPLLRTLLVCGVGLHIAAFVVFAPRIAVKKEPEMSGPAVHWAGITKDARDQMALSDSEPLFLPTRLNYGQSGGFLTQLSHETDLGESPLGGYVPMLQVVEGKALPLPTEKPFEIPKLSDVLGLEHWGIAQMMGRVTQPRFELYARQAFLRVEREADGTLVFEEPIKINVGVGDAGDDWRPVAYVCSMDLQGLAGPPLEVPWTNNGLGCGKPEIDVLIRNYLGTMPLSARLKPGRYRLIVGP